MKWEYKIVKMEKPTRIILNDLGADEWELVLIEHTVEGRVAVFKRELLREIKYEFLEDK